MITEADIAIRKPLTVERIKDLWSKTYNKQGKPDWSHIFPYYHDNIVFQDSIQRIDGKGNFIVFCNRLTNRCEKLAMDIFTITRTSTIFMFDWRMEMMFRNWPNTPIFGATKLTLAEDNRIIRQRDYYDLWGDIFNNIPWFHKPYRRIMERYFG